MKAGWLEWIVQLVPFYVFEGLPEVELGSSSPRVRSIEVHSIKLANIPPYFERRVEVVKNSPVHFF